MTSKNRALSSAINQINNLLQLSEKPTHSKSPFHYRKMQQRQMSENSGIADDDDIDSNQADESIPSSPISSPDHIHNGHDTDSKLASFPLSFGSHILPTAHSRVSWTSVSKIMGKRKSGETLELSAGIKKKKSGFAPGTPMPRKQSLSSPPSTSLPFGQPFDIFSMTGLEKRSPGSGQNNRRKTTSCQFPAKWQREYPKAGKARTMCGFSLL